MILSPLASLPTLGDNRLRASGLALVVVNSTVPFPLFLEPSCQCVLGIAYPQPAKWVQLRKTAGLKDSLGPLLRAFEPLLCVGL